jgi:hypothetical protein
MTIFRDYRRFDDSSISDSCNITKTDCFDRVHAAPGYFYIARRDNDLIRRRQGINDIPRLQNFSSLETTKISLGLRFDHNTVSRSKEAPIEIKYSIIIFWVI